MKYLFLFLTLLNLNLAAQDFINQVLVLNEGYYNYSDSSIEVPVVIGSYNPTTQTYVNLDTINGARFASDLVIDGDFYYVAADSFLIKYDLNTHQRIATATVPGIRNIAISENNLFVTRGEYLINYESYLQVYSLNDLSFVMQFDTTVGPSYSSQNMIIKDNKLFVAINNGFEYQNEKGFVGVVDLSNMSYDTEIDLGIDGLNPDNMMTDDDFLYTVNNKDFSGASISKISLTDYSVSTVNIAAASTGCGTSTFRDDKLIYQISGTTELLEWDPQLLNNYGDLIDISQGFYELSYEGVNEYLYASSTDYVSSGNVYIYNNENELVEEFECGVSPGTIAFDIRNTTGITNFNFEFDKSQHIFDIQGNKLESLKNASPGLYIQNGKKIVVVQKL